MFVKITKQDDIEIVSLIEAKAQCNLLSSFTLDDDLLNTLISTCSKIAQTKANKMLSSGTYVGSWPSYSEEVILWSDNVSSVDSVIAMDEYRNQVDIEGYELDAFTGQLYIPEAYANLKNFRATVNVTVENVQPEISLAVKMMIASAYNSREDSVLGLSVSKVPVTSETLLKSVRHQPL